MCRQVNHFYNCCKKTVLQPLQLCTLYPAECDIVWPETERVAQFCDDCSENKEEVTRNLIQEAEQEQMLQKAKQRLEENERETTEQWYAIREALLVEMMKDAPLPEGEGGNSISSLERSSRLLSQLLTTMAAKNLSSSSEDDLELELAAADVTGWMERIEQDSRAAHLERLIEELQLELASQASPRA